MRSWRCLLLAAGTTAWLSSPVLAQFYLAPGGRMTKPSQIVIKPEVQKELKLSDEQIRKVNDVSQQIRDLLQNDFAKLAELDGKDRDEKKMVLVKKVTKLESEGLDQVLNPVQRKRLKELAIQHAGVQALKNPEVEAALKLTDEQKQKIQAVMQGAIADMRKLFQETRDGLGGSQEKAARIREQTADRALAVLTTDQKKVWKDLQGEPFAIQKVETARPSLTSPVGQGPTADPAQPSADKTDLAWVEKRAEEWLPTRDERKFDDIAWVGREIVRGLNLGKEHHRPVFVFTHDGFVNRGRC